MIYVRTLFSLLEGLSLRELQMLLLCHASLANDLPFGFQLTSVLDLENGGAFSVILLSDGAVCINSRGSYKINIKPKLFFILQKFFHFVHCTIGMEANPLFGSAVQLCRLGQIRP